MRESGIGGMCVALGGKTDLAKWFGVIPVARLWHLASECRHPWQFRIGLRGDWAIENDRAHFSQQTLSCFGGASTTLMWWLLHTFLSE